MPVPPVTAAVRRSVGIVVAAVLAAGALACDQTSPVEPGGVRSVALIPQGTTLRPGSRMTVLAAPLDAQGNVLDVPVTWQSLSPTLLSVDPAGEVTALAPGSATLRATAGGVSNTLRLSLVNPPAARITLAPEPLELSLPGPAVRLAGVALDSADGELIGAQIAWRSDAPRLATVDDSGRVTPVAVGLTEIIAELDGARAVRVVQVSPLVTPTAPTVTAVTPGVIRPGVAFTIRGARFGATPLANTVHVDGIPAAVSAATPTEITAVLPLGSFPCVPTTSVAVQVSTSGGVGAGSAVLEVAPQRRLAVGESLILDGAAASACNELVDGDGRYLVAVQHVGRALGVGGIGVSLLGRTGVDVSPLAFSVGTPAARAGTDDAHYRLQERNRQLAAQPRRSVTPEAELQLPPVGGIVPVRVPNLDDQNFCSSFTPIGARSVYEGPRIVILEDTLSQRFGVPTLAGQMDAVLQAVGQEAETVMLPLASRFGDPFAMDSRLDANGKIVLVVTPRLNEMQGGALLGAVVTCDFFPRAQFASSNFGEVLYLQAPTSADPGFGEGTRETWRWEIRGTIAHELKHIASFAERIVRGQPLEESWLEEATARHAEELYARARLGFGAGDDVGFDALRCEVLAPLGASDCAGTPRTLLPHFEALWDFLDAPTARSPLGPVAPGDFSYYGSAWSLLRWAMDNATLDEAAFIAQLTASGQAGVANLEARAGRSWEDLLARWTLALLAESVPPAAPTNPSLGFRSWDLSDAFAGLCAALTPCSGPGSDRFSRPRPLRSLTVPNRSWTVDVAEILPAGFVAVDVAPGVVGTRRLLRLQGLRGGPLPSAARLVVLRVQ